MSKLYIFGIGGTGSRVLRSLTMLLASGVDCGADSIVPIIIDPDYSNADLTRTVSLLNKYSTIRKQLSFGTGLNGSFFRCDIEKILPNYSLQIKDTDDRTFRSFIEQASMSKANRAMTSMLFSTKNLNSHMDVGFKGNPNIGSVVLNQISQSEDFTLFANSFEKGDKIFIISSIFGGTGASGFPLLLKTLRTGNTFPNYSLINDCEIGAITILPYFKVKQDEDSEIDSSTFMSKSKSALAYYENNIIKNGQINALYFLGDNMTGMYDNHDGGASQQNNAHLIEFFASTAIVDFGLKSHPTTVNKELGIKDVSTSVTFNDFYTGLSTMLRMPLTQFALMSNCLSNQYDYLSSSTFNANNTLHIDSTFYSKPFMIELKSFTEDYRDWLEEMKDNRRSLDLFDLSCVSTPFELVTGVKPKRIMSPKSNYSLFFDRLNSSSKDTSGERENRFMEMFALATKKLCQEKFNF